MEIVRAREAGEGVREKISDIFVDGFIQWLQYFSKDTGKLSRAFAHMFIPEDFYIAVIDGEPAGIAACTDGKNPPVRIRTSEFRRHLGVVRGIAAGIMLKRELQNHSYPFPIESGTGSVEYVATRTKFRGKGVASAIIKHIIREEGYTSYVLSVADTNTNAFRLYEALGFREFLRVPHKYAKQSGINYTVYMKYDPAE